MSMETQAEACNARRRSPHTARRRPWGDTPVCRYCGSPSVTVDRSGALLCASCAERLRLIRIIRTMLGCEHGGADAHGATPESRPKIGGGI